MPEAFYSQFEKSVFFKRQENVVLFPLVTQINSPLFFDIRSKSRAPSQLVKV